jgi:hypothetical protein
MEQSIITKFCVKIGISASETSALAYGKYAMKKSRVCEWHRQSKEEGDDVQIPKNKAAKNKKDKE